MGIERNEVVMRMNIAIRLIGYCLLLLLSSCAGFSNAMSGFSHGYGQAVRSQQPVTPATYYKQYDCSVMPTSDRYYYVNCN